MAAAAAIAADLLASNRISSPNVSEQRKSFHPAFSATPPPKPPNLTKPAPPSRFNRNSISFQPGEASHLLEARGLPDSEENASDSKLRRTGSRYPIWEDEADYPFDEEDSEHNIIFTPETADQSRPAVKAAKLEKLIERLTYEKYPDPDYVTAFLLTYRSFTTPAELLGLLITRYNVPEPRKLSEKDREVWVKNKQNPIQLRVFNALKAWLQTHFYDFSSDTSLTSTLLDFINTSMIGNGNTAMDKAGEQLKKIIAKKQEGDETESKVHFSTAPPKPIVPSDLSNVELNDIDPLEIARQLTLIEYSLYKAIKPWECLGQAWTKKATRDQKAPNIMAIIQRFNAVSRWAATEILKVESVKKRAATLERFIQIAMGFEKLNNYNGMMEILSGMQGAAVFRLKQTWAACNKQYLKKYEEMHTLMGRDKNFQKFRDHLHNVDPPCIPYIGMYLTDLTFIEDGNKDYVTDEGLINFDKRRKILTVIREIQQYQQTPYCLEKVPEIQDKLHKLDLWEENEAFAASMRLEPKDPSQQGNKKNSGNGLFSRSKRTPKKKSSDKPDKDETAKPDKNASAQEDEKDDEEDFGELEHIEGYRFNEPDSKDNLVFDIDVSTMVEGAKPSIKAATIEKLVERLTHEDWPDPSLANIFLLTYRTFTTAQEVIDLLTMRFNPPWPKDTSQEVRERYNMAKRLPIRLRVFNVIKNWADKYDLDPAVLPKIEALADLMIQGGMEDAGQRIKKRCREGSEPLLRRPSQLKPPVPYLPSNISGQPTLLDFHPEEMARQLALLQQRLFVKIKPRELLGKLWSGSDKERASPNVLAVIQEDMRTRMWVATDIVKQPSYEVAAQHVTQWIKVAEKCLNLNNFASMVCIVSALMMPEIQKLKLVWGHVSYKNALNKLKAFLEGNYTKLQDKLHNVQPPCVPYLGAYLHTLAEIDEKHCTHIKTTHNLVNFEKCTLTATALLEIQQYQQSPYSLESVGTIQLWIESEEAWAIEQITEASTRLMTKGKQKKYRAQSTSIEEEDLHRPTTPPANLSRSASSKLTKVLGKDYEDQQRLSSSKSMTSKSQSVCYDGPREPRSSSDEGMDKRQALRIQVLSLFVDDSEFRQFAQDALLQDVRKELEEFKASANAQIATLKSEIAALKARLKS